MTRTIVSRVKKSYARPDPVGVDRKKQNVGILFDRLRFVGDMKKIFPCSVHVGRGLSRFFREEFMGPKEIIAA